MPSKKSNKGKKSGKLDLGKGVITDETFEKLLQDESNKANDQTSSHKKPMLKCSQWTQEANWLDVNLFVGEKVRTEDVKDVNFKDQRCELQLSDGREWNMHFYQPIDKTQCRVQLRGNRILLKVKKKTPGNWLDIQYIPGQSDKLSPVKKKPPVKKSEPPPKPAAPPVKQVSSEEEDPSENTKGVNQVREIGQSAGEGQSADGASVTVETETATFDEPKPDLSDLVQEDPKPFNEKSEEPQKVAEGFVYNLLHVKNDYYEKTVLKSNDTVSIQIFVKGIVKDSLQVLFEGRLVSVKFTTTNKCFLSLHADTDESTVFCWAIEVVAELLESQCKYKLTPNYLELTLRKVVAERWCALESVHAKGKVRPSSDWIAASGTKSTAKVPPNNVSVATTKNDKSKCIFDEMEDQENSKDERAESDRNNTGATPSKGSVLTDSNKVNVQKPTCMVSPLKPPKEKQVITPGYTGLDNLGNTCFMNSVLQVLANTRELKDYFLENHHQNEINVDNPLGSQGKLAGEFGQLIQKLWSGTKFSYAPTSLKKLIAQKKSMFSGFAQHDAQEYMSYLLDGLHEDVNRVRKKPYVEQNDSDGRRDEEVADESWDNHKKRNDSFLVDLFQGQFKSKLVCPACEKVSVTFDPFMHLPVPLPKKQKVLPVVFMSRDPRRKPLKVMVKVAKHATVEVLKDAVAEKTGLHSKNLRVFEAYHSKIHCVFEKRASLNHVADTDKILVHEVLSPEIAGEPVKELIVIQRLSIPRNKPSRCACCGKDNKVGSTLLRCTGCYRVGYCDITCQKEDWQRHKVNCRSHPDNVGTPFLISLPQSQATFSRISQMADMYSRYSVNVFQPPQTEQPSSPAVSEPSSSASLSTGSGSNPESDSLLNKATEERDKSGEDCSSQTSSTNVSTDPSTCSFDTTDSGRGTSVAMETEASVMSSSASSQDTESWSVGENSGRESMSVSTSSTSLSTDLDDLQMEGDRETGEGQRPVKQTRIVMGRQQDPEKPAPQFMFKPCDKDGHVTKDGKKLEDLGEEALALDNVQFLAMEWKNNEKYRPFVQVETKDLIHTVDPSVNTVISEENKDITLDRCLSLFTEPETLSSEEAWYCPKCKEHREASKQMSLWRLPNILIIQLKRFSYRNLLWCDKVDKMVEFPTTGLDMSDFFSAHSSDPGQSPIYDLYGVVNHYGGIMGGHYTSYVRCVDKEGHRNEVGWRLCDDSHVSKTSENQVVTRAAYVLFYRRRGMHLALPEPCISPQPAEKDGEKTGQLDIDSEIFTISPERETNTDNDEKKGSSPSIFDIEFPRTRPRSFSFSEGDTRSHGQRGGAAEDTFLDNKYIDSDFLQQPVPCTDMDSVD